DVRGADPCRSEKLWELSIAECGMRIAECGFYCGLDCGLRIDCGLGVRNPNPQSAIRDPQFTDPPMTRRQRGARLLIAVFGEAFAVFVAREFKRRENPPPVPATAGKDPGAVVETTGGRGWKFNGSREAAGVTFQKQLTYADGSSRLLGVTIITDERNGDRTFTITAKEGLVGKNESSIALDGDVQLAGSDGMTVLTQHATYAASDGTVRAPGPVTFTRGRVRGTGTGMTWEQTRDLLTILDQAVVHIVPDEKGANAADVTSGAAAFARRDKYIRFERTV